MNARVVAAVFPDDAAVDAATRDFTSEPAAADPPPAEPETTDQWRAMVAGLQIELRLARQPETPPNLKPLKRAAGLAGIDDETARRWCVDNIVAAKQIGKRWYVDPAALRAHKQLKNAK